MEFFSEHIGPYPYEKLADVEAAGMSGGMEHASEIFFGQSSVSGRPDLQPGGARNRAPVVRRFRDRKGLGRRVAERRLRHLFPLLTTEHYQGRDAFVAGLQRASPQRFHTEKRMPGVAVVQAQAVEGHPQPDRVPEGRLGVARAARADRRRRNSGQASASITAAIATPTRRRADFRQVMEEVSASDLGWFFDQWLYRAGSPVVEGGWKYDAAAKKIEVDLTQTQAGDAFRLPLEIAVKNRQVRIEKIEMTAKQQRFEIAAGEEPEAVELDPNTWMLMDARFAKLGSALH